MHVKYLPVFLGLWLLCLAALPAFATPKDGSGTWPACMYPYQGEFVSGAVKSIDCDVSTVAFPGKSTLPLQPFGDCVYIDNNTAKTFFIPLKKKSEWDAFKTHPPVGLTLRPCSKS